MATSPQSIKRVLVALRKVQKQLVEAGEIIGKLSELLDAPPLEANKPRKRKSTEEIRARRIELNGRK